MRLLAKVGSLRTVVAALAGMMALQMGLVALGNITDYQTNHAFVKHVLAMDTTFRSSHVMWRAITNPTLVTAAYIGIIVWESVLALTLAAGFLGWVRGLDGRRDVEVARRLTTTGWLMLLLLFGGGFIAVGGEWFEMWQSSEWNGLTPALQNLLIAAVGLILSYLPAAGSPVAETPA